MNLLALLLYAVTVTFNWTASAGGAMGYEICEAATPGHANPICTDVLNVTSTPVETDVQVSKFWRVRAYNKYGTNKAYSGWSNEVKTGAPNFPSGLVVPSN